jgi:hypothetical protein
MKNYALILLLVISQSAFAMGRHRTSSAGGTTETYNLYTIKKGHHYSKGKKQNFLKTKTHFEYSVLFDDSAKYTTATLENQHDINKLVGFIDCGSLNVHKNSARFGWRWYQGAVQILAYTYVDKVRNSEYLGDAEIGKPAHYSIKVDGSQYVFNFNGREVRMLRGCHKAHTLKTGEYPYFGGDEVAPHKVQILIKYL